MHAQHVGKFRGFGLKYWILGIVSETPATGAMIMKKMEEMSMGYWRPSPGNIYPLLEEMTKAGLISMKIKNVKKFYISTEKGKEHLQSSWFPWKEIQARQTMARGSIEEAIESMEGYADFLLDNIDKINGNKQNSKKISGIIQKLKTLGEQREHSAKRKAKQVFQ